MFTGIIEAVGSVRAIEPRGGDVRLSIATGKTAGLAGAFAPDESPEDAR